MKEIRVKTKCLQEDDKLIRVLHDKLLEDKLISQQNEKKIDISFRKKVMELGWNTVRRIMLQSTKGGGEITLMESTKRFLCGMRRGCKMRRG